MESYHSGQSSRAQLPGNPPPEGSVERALRLVRLFCPAVEDFATLTAVAPEAVPAPYRELLDHTNHMTVVMEQFHGEPPQLQVVARWLPEAGRRGDWYAREILLRSAAGKVWQQGIVRIDLDQIDPATAALIRQARLPLGRVLINAGLLREVQHVALVKVVPGRHLATLFGGESGRVPAGSRATYGRVAEISLGGVPAVELLEIVAPG
jgi:chorismate-pyruvate lyase